MSYTPGSQHDRDIGLDVNVKHDEKKLNIILLSPWMKAVVDGQHLFDIYSL